MLEKLKRLLHIKSRSRKGDQDMQRSGDNAAGQNNHIATGDSAPAYNATQWTRPAPFEDQGGTTAQQPGDRTRSSSQYSLQRDAHHEDEAHNAYSTAAAAPPQSHDFEPRPLLQPEDSDKVPHRDPAPLRPGDQDSTTSFHTAEAQVADVGTRGLEHGPPTSAYPAANTTDAGSGPSSSQQYPPGPTPQVPMSHPVQPVHIDDEDNPNVNTDYTLDVRDPVVHEHIKPHVHTIYEPRRTRSIHLEEHYYRLQPVIVPEDHPLAAQAQTMEEAEAQLRAQGVTSPVVRGDGP